MSTARVRAAVLADVDEITRIQRQTWRLAYTDLLGSSALDELDSEQTPQHWAEAVETPDSDVLIAAEDSTTVGFCVAGLAPDSEMADSTGAVPADAGSTALLGTILVEPRWGRRGHGGRLLAHVAARLRARGATRALSWVAQADSATLSFFRRAGWHPDGTMRSLDTGEKTLREIRLSGGLEFELTQ